MREPLHIICELDALGPKGARYLSPNGDYVVIPRQLFIAEEKPLQVLIVLNDQSNLIRHRGITDDRLRDAARLYREAVSQGSPPRRYIAESFGRAEGTVATWIGLARKRIDPSTGEPFLRPAIGTRVGEEDG